MERKEHGFSDEARRAVLVAALVFAGLFVFTRFGLFELLTQDTLRHESWRIDELLTGLVFVSICLVAFYWRSLKRSEEKRGRGEKKFRALFDRAADAILVNDLSGKILDANRHACESLGYSREELLGRHISEVEVSFDAEYARLWERLLADDRVTVEGTHRRKDGSTFPVETRVSTFEMDGEPTILSLARDVSESRKAVDDLRASEAREWAVLRSIPDAVCRITRSGTYLDVWAGETRRLYQPREVLLGRNVADILGEEVARRFLPLVERAIETNEVQIVEYPLSTPEGKFEIEARIVASGSDEAIYFARDVTERNETLERLSGSEARNRTILEAIPDLVFRYTRDGEYLDLHAASEGKLYAPREELLGKNLRDILPPEVADRILERIAMTLDSGEMQVFEYELAVPDGDLHFEARIVASGEDEVICFARDVTEHDEMSKELCWMEARNRSILEAIPDVVFRYSRDGEYLDIHVNDDFRLYTSREYLLGRNLKEVLPPETAEEFMRAISETLQTGETQCFEYEITTPEEEFHREARLVRGGPDEVICFVRDIGERRGFESKITRLAYVDELTGLPNRASFMERLGEVAEEPGRAAMLMISLRGFAKVNDSLGREAGDRLLAMVADHARRFFRDKGVVARFGGDEFAVLFTGFSSFDEVREVIEEGQSIYPRMPFVLDELEIFLTADIGVALIEAGDTPDEVVRKSSVALLEAKEDVEADYKVFDASMSERAVERLRLERDLRLALEYGQLKVHYQPEVFLSSGRIYSLEALARWNHPEHGPLSPSVFIPLAEESGLILRLGEYVLEEACRRMRLWRESLPEKAPCSVSVNISAVQLRQRDLVSRVARILDENGLEPECLQLEVTESAAMEDLDSCLRIFGELKDLGVRIALDDFGTGYSSLSCLRQFPLDALKVDRSFISSLENDPQMANVVGSIIELAHALELEVISEGIETPGQLSILRSLCSDIGQGYHFSYPLPPEEALELLASWRTLNLLRSSG